MSGRNALLLRILTAAAAIGSLAHVSVLFPRYIVTDPAVPAGLRLLVGTLTLTVAAALGACLLALVLVVRSWREAGARALALFLAAVATVWGSMLRLLRVDLDGSTLNLQLQTNTGLQGLVLSVAVVLAAASFLRFSALFPVPLDAAALPPARRLHRLRRLRVALLRPGPVWATAAAILLFINGFAEWGMGLLGVEAVAAGAGAPPGERTAAIVALVVLVGGGLVVAPLGALALGLRNLVSGYRAAGPADRRRVLWLVTGTVTAGWMLLLPVIVLPILALLSLSGGWIFLSGVLLWFLAPAVLVVAAAVAVFYSGAVDPRLVLQRSTIIAIVGALAFLVFTTLESLLSHWFEATLGLPGLLGSVLAGCVSALLLIPLRGVLRRFAGRLFASPAATDTSAPAPGTQAPATTRPS